jgi:hypothetical protein
MLVAERNFLFMSRLRDETRQQVKKIDQQFKNEVAASSLLPLLEAGQGHPNDFY